MRYSDYERQILKSRIKIPRLKIRSFNKLIFPPWVLGFGIKGLGLKKDERIYQISKTTFST